MELPTPRGAGAFRAHTGHRQPATGNRQVQAAATTTAVSSRIVEAHTTRAANRAARSWLGRPSWCEMRVRPIVGNALPAWAVPTPPLQSETTKSPVHALGRRRALPRPTLPFTALAGEAGGGGTYLVGWNQCHGMIPPLRAGAQVGEEGFSDETSALKHDNRGGDPASGVEVTRRPTVLADEPGSNDERVEKKGRVRHRLSAMQVQQQALIRRLRTLEARRDWRGVLAAMVREREPDVSALAEG